MSPRTVCAAGAQVVSLAAIVWLVSENHALQTKQPETLAKPATASARPSRASERAAVEGQGESSATASARKRRPAEGGSGQTPGGNPARSRLDIEATPEGGAILRWPGVVNRVELSAEELLTIQQEMRSALLSSTETRPGGPSWSPGQAAGAPDTEGHGDYRTAWASADPDGGKEWLQLSYPESTEIGEIVIHESYNPGAVSRVVALMPDGSEQVLWEGTETTAQPGQDLDSVFKAPPGIRSDQIRVELDTARVPGWNEIDAVELVGSDGKRQWASASKASSYYGQNRGIASASEGFLQER